MDIQGLLHTHGQHPADDLITGYYAESTEIQKDLRKEKNTSLNRTSLQAYIYH